MREIKFRAWVTPECRRGYKMNQMLDWKFVWLEMQWDGKFNNLFFEGKTIIPMQFTGLLDKRGTEIFEGDIVVDRFGKKSEVYWNGGAFMLKESTPIFLNQFYDIEVIGNIYENKNLS